MSKNYVSEGRNIRLAVDSDKVSGDPEVVGNIACVLITDPDDDDNATVGVEGIYSPTLKAINGGGNSAIAPGDKIYYVVADTPHLSKKATGDYFGTYVGLTTITAGATSTGKVKLKGGA